MPKKLNNLWYALGLSMISILIGVIGFMRIEDYSELDSFFMAIITISTVGFEEVRPLSDSGKIFTSLYIILNLTIFAYVISVITTYLFEGELRSLFRIFMSERELKKFNKHIIVVGYGRNGYMAANELEKSKKQFIIIERDDKSVEEISKNKKLPFLQGDATADETLIAAGIHRAESIITTLPKDSDNVFITLTARELNPQIKIISRASRKNSETKLYRAGANHVIMPDAIGGLHMAQLITKPYVIEFLELLEGEGGEDLRLEEFAYTELNKESRGKSLKDLDIRAKTGASVIGFKHKYKGFVFNPSPETVIGEEDILIVLGSNNDINGFKKQYL